MVAMASTASAALALKGLSTPCYRLPSTLPSSSSASFHIIAYANHRHCYHNIDRNSFPATTSSRTPGARITNDASELVDCNFLRAFHDRQFRNQRQVATAASATPAAETVLSESTSTTANAGSDTLISNIQSMSSPKSNVEGDGAAGITEEDDLGVFTKFIDEQLLQSVNNKDVENPVRQTVLMTDGTDTRPYRLIWPSPSLIFDVSPEPAFSATSTKQKDKGLKASRSYLLQHVSVDFMQEDLGDNWVDNLLRKGYRGDAPSVWAIEMPRTKISVRSFQGILSVASSLLMKGSTILGVISCPWIGISELETRALLRRLFVGQGFTLKVLSYEELTSNSQSECSGLSIGSTLDVPFAFIAQQQRLSDAQVEYARMQVEMAEEVDEEGFEDSW